MTRTKKKVVIAPDEAGAMEALHDYAEGSSRLKEIEGSMELAIQKVRDQYTDKVNKIKGQMEEHYQLVHAYATENKDTIFAKKKSIDWAHGILGFRRGTPKVVKERGLTWDTALKLMKANRLPFIRTKEEIDREKIIMSRDDKSMMEELTKIGIGINQDETFYIEPKEEVLV